MKRILVVDDSPTIRRMMIASLRSLRDVEFDEANNGLEAIERLALAPVSLLFLDLNMPDIHGVEVIEFVRGHQAYRDIPICVVTTRGDEESRVQVLRAGANVYLTKPFTPQQLITEANRLLLASG
ncbi:MAG TPA: response regulator [Pyrinomonadaceae bacterium]|nr:response regulator [Pyrinomonadaceae bacterium]